MTPKALTCRYAWSFTARSKASLEMNWKTSRPRSRLIRQPVLVTIDRPWIVPPSLTSTGDPSDCGAPLDTPTMAEVGYLQARAEVQIRP